MLKLRKFAKVFLISAPRMNCIRKLGLYKEIYGRLYTRTAHEAIGQPCYQENTQSPFTRYLHTVEADVATAIRIRESEEGKKTNSGDHKFVDSVVQQRVTAGVKLVSGPEWVIIIQ